MYINLYVCKLDEYIYICLEIMENIEIVIIFF